MYKEELRQYSVTQHDIILYSTCRIRVYLASLSCLAMILRMVTRAMITVVVSGVITARAIVHPSGVAGLVGGTFTLH